MAFTRYGLRFGWLVATVTLCTATMSTTASAGYFDNHSGTTTVSSYADNSVIFVSYADYQPAIEFKAVGEHKQITRDYPAYRSPTAKPQANIASVRPTSVSGWRSGRVRTLAG